MQLGTCIANFTFCLLYLTLCYGGPTGESSSTSRFIRQYSADEEMFIFNELRRYPGKWLPIWGQDMWIEIAKHHCKIRESDTCKFPPRTATGLRTYFQKRILNSKGKVTLPDDVMRRISTSQKEKHGDESRQTDLLENEDQYMVSEDQVSPGDDLREMNRIHIEYTPEEVAFIINFVKNYPGEHGQASRNKMWAEAAAQHREMRKSNPSAFPQERSGCALRKQLSRMARSGRIRNIKEITTSPGAHLRETKNIKLKYTPEEDAFILNFAKNYPDKDRPVSKETKWTEAAEQLREIRKTNPLHFPQERTVAALHKQFRRLSRRTNLNNTKETTEDDERMDADKVVLSFARYTREEDDFVIEELLKPTCTSIYSVAAWKKIKARHDIKVQSKTPGFGQYRSVTSLKRRFLHSILKQRYKESLTALKKKFSRNFPTAQDETDSEFDFMDGTSNAWEAGNDDSAIWDMDFEQIQRECEFETEAEGEDSLELDAFIEELRNAPVDVNFDLLKKAE